MVLCGEVKLSLRELTKSREFEVGVSVSVLQVLCRFLVFPLKTTVRLILLYFKDTFKDTRLRFLSSFTSLLFVPCTMIPLSAISPVMTQL